jgi:hypothetical protein
MDNSLTVPLKIKNINNAYNFFEYYISTTCGLEVLGEKNLSDTDFYIWAKAWNKDKTIIDLCSNSSKQDSETMLKVYNAQSAIINQFLLPMSTAFYALSKQIWSHTEKNNTISVSNETMSDLVGRLGLAAAPFTSSEIERLEKIQKLFDDFSTMTNVITNKLLIDQNPNKQTKFDVMTLQNYTMGRTYFR